MREKALELEAQEGLASMTPLGAAEPLSLLFSFSDSPPACLQQVPPSLCFSSATAIKWDDNLLLLGLWERLSDEGGDSV